MPKSTYFRIFLGIFSAFFVMLSLYLLLSGRESHKKNAAVEEEIDQLRSQAQRYAQEKESISERIAYLQTESFQELQAKEKRAMKRHEEHVVVIRSAQEDDSSDAEIHTYQEDSRVEVSNIEKWWRHFFGA